LIRHTEFPEARDLPDAEQEKVIEHVGWIFRRAWELGLKNFIKCMFIVTTPAFARAHGHDVDMPVSETVDWRHNYGHKTPDQSHDKMVHWGLRNEKTRAFTESAIAEVFQTYPELDGFIGVMGEALPGKRSTWFKEAVVPGLKRSGRKPIFILFHWMLPLDDFLEDIVPKEVYDNTWLAIEHNGEVISDAEPYPISTRWAKQSGLPTVMQIVPHNFSTLPFNSPEFAYQMVREAKKIDNYKGIATYLTGGSLNSTKWGLFARGVAYYEANDVDYSDEPWIDTLAGRFGDRQAALHFLNAYKASARITPGINQIAWSPHDGRCTDQLILKYWHWSTQNLKFSHFASPAKGAALLPLRHYARVVARYGARFRDNDGSVYKQQHDAAGAALQGHTGAQELIWGHIDYQVTPEAHMRKVRQYGATCLREAEAGMPLVKTNVDQAQRLFNEMKTYKLLTDYYERKVLAAVSALIYSFGGDPQEKERAEKLADETVELYQVAADFMWEHLDNKSGQIRGGVVGREERPEGDGDVF